MSIEYRLAKLSDVEDLVDHLIRHLREPGFNGTLAHPFLPDHPWNRQEKLTNIMEVILKNLDEERWFRSFIAIEDNVIKGHLDLKNLFSATLHRAQLGMGLEESIRGQGHGKILMKMALEWARNQESLEWIDLSYFAHNKPAGKLYKSFGFSELFIYEDRLRVGGTSIDDVFMTLKLKN